MITATRPATADVPNRDTVAPVSRVEPVRNDTARPAGTVRTGHRRAEDRAAAAARRAALGAPGAAPGFAVSVLVEAGLAGSDPFAGARARAAYAGRPVAAALVTVA